MHCPSCGVENPESMRFCGACAAPLQLRCPQCGYDNPPRFKFCGQCATPLTGTASSPPVQVPLSYTPRYLVEKILTSRSALEGERKQVTVLFADLKGAVELLADHDPEEARQLLAPVLERMMQAVYRYEGTVNQVLGDGLMALFGAPIAHEDHAVRAGYAALTMQAAIATYAEQLQQQHGISLQARVGLNAGEVVVGGIGDDLAMDYTAVGQTTNLAARMEQLAVPGTIQATAAFVRLTEGYLRFKALGLTAVKGLPHPVEVFELVGAAPARTRIQAAAARGLTRFVGRHTEVQALQAALERAARGHGQIVAVIGEPGIGKSRIVDEFITSPPTQDWLILATSAVSYDQATPYLPIRNLLTAYFHIDDWDDEAAIQEKVDKRLALDMALQLTRPAVLALLDVAVDDPEWQAVDLPQRRLRISAGVKRLLLRQSQMQPLLLVVEDLHWIDTETQALLDSLVESLPGARLLLIVNYRPEYQHGWGSKSSYTQLRLDPLPPKSAEEVLQALLGDDVGVQRAVPLQPLKQLLITRTEGNPFFLEESVRTLVETGVLAGEPGAYHLARALPTIQVPATVQAVLAARIDRLPPEEKRLLQTAAVIGTDVPLPLLQAIAEVSEEGLRRGLAHLQAGEFLHEMSLFPELVYTFTHALTQEVASRSLLREQRRVLHARIVEAIERLAGDRLADQVERLALHAFRGEVWKKALVYLRQAGDKAMARSAYREAVAYYEQALEVLAHLPAARQVHEEAIDLRFNLRNVLLPLGEQGRILDHLRQAASLAEALHDQQRLGWVSIYMTSCFYNMGRPDHAVGSGERALAMAASLGDVALDIQAAYYLGLAYHLLGDFRQAVGVLSRNVAALEGALVYERFGLPYLPSVFSRTWLAWCLAELGAFAEGIRRAAEGVQIAEAIDQPWDRLAAYRGLGLLYLSKGEVQTAIPFLERCLDLCRGWNIAGWLAVVAAQLGYAYALTGRLSEALPLLELAVGQPPAKRSVYHARLVGYLSEAYLLEGRPEQALPLAVSALELSCTRGERGFQAWGLRLLGDIHARRDAPEDRQAEGYYQQALALAGELGMRPLLAHCHRGLGTLYAKLGWREQAHTELSKAIVLYRDMDMAFWLPQAQAALEWAGGLPE